ncbi:MAG: hypothetical protein K5793_07015, partial [Nitrosarchaeum sp.]|nr:hypothetical protein [Nitrosarchaeum sp.]
TLSDSVSLTDNTEANKSITQTLSDSVSITDTASFAITKTLSDSMTVSDTIVTSAAQTKTLSDSITISSNAVSTKITSQGVRTVVPATGTTTVNVSNNNSTIVLSSSSTVNTINISEGTNQSLFLDYSANVTGGVVSAITNGYTVNFHANHAGTNQANAGKIALASGTSFTGASGWDGKLKLPTVTQVSVPTQTTTSGSTTTTTSYSDTAVFEIGLDSGTISLSKPARIEFTNDAQPNFVAFFVVPGGQVTFIETQCAEDSAAGLGTNDECIIQVGDNLVVWTDHFTKFGVSKKSTSSTSSDSGSSGASSGGGRTGVGPSGTGRGVGGFGGILATPLTIHEITYDRCEDYTATILVSSDADLPPEITIHTSKSGTLQGTLAENQPYEELNKLTKIDKYLYEIPIASDETFMMIIATETKGVTTNTVQGAVHITQCADTIVISKVDQEDIQEISSELPRIFDVKFQIENSTAQPADTESEFSYVDNQDITVSAIVDSKSPIQRAELRTVTLGQPDDQYIAVKMDVSPIQASESLYVVSGTIPAFLLQNPAVTYWIHIINDDLNEQESKQYVIGVKPISPINASIELDMPNTKESGSVFRTSAYVQSNDDTPAYGVISLIVDGKTVSRTAQLIQPEQTKVDFEWSIPSVNQYTTHGVQAKIDFYDKSISTSTGILNVVEKTRTISLQELEEIKPIVDSRGSLVAEPALLYASNPHDGNLRFQVVSEDGMCVIGSASDCAIQESTYNNRGGLESITIDDSVYRVKYSGPDSILERFSITSIDPILADWSITLESENGLVSDAYAMQDVSVKIQYRVHSEMITLVS